jgi:hypothetical protein
MSIHSTTFSTVSKQTLFISAASAIRNFSLTNDWRPSLSARLTASLWTGGFDERQNEADGERRKMGP